jgi:hypothetical protein
MKSIPCGVPEDNSADTDLATRLPSPSRRRSAPGRRTKFWIHHSVSVSVSVIQQHKVLPAEGF